MLKTHNRSHKYNSKDAMASSMLTHFWLKFTDMLLFTVCVIPIHKYLMLKFSIRKDIFLNRTHGTETWSVNFNQECVSILLAIGSLLLHL